MDAVRNIDETREGILKNTESVSSEYVLLEDSVNRVLAKSVFSVEDVPTFRRSQVDGYALRFEDTVGATRDRPVTLKVIEEVPAGHESTCTVKAGTALKILTGAPIPAGASAIVKSEETESTDQNVKIFSPCSEHQYLSPIGADMVKGIEIAKKGTQMTPELVGVFASQGFSFVEVYRKVRVGVLSTGSELVGLRENASTPYIRGSNYYMLMAACSRMGVQVIPLGMIKDNTEEIKKSIDMGSEACDLLISTGGVAGSDYDLIPEAMESAQFNVLQRGIDIQPGHAFAYGKKDRTLFIGLSGSPRASMVIFYLLVQSVIRRLAGHGEDVKKGKAILTHDMKRGKAKTFAVPGRVTHKEGVAYFAPQDKKENGSLYNMVSCNGIAILDGKTNKVTEGSLVEVYFMGSEV